MAEGPDARDRRRSPGGIAAWGEFKQAAHLTALGLDGWLYLESEDPVERYSLLALAGHVGEIRKAERRELASFIVDELAKSIKKGQKR